MCVEESALSSQITDMLVIFDSIISACLAEHHRGDPLKLSFASLELSSVAKELVEFAACLPSASPTVVPPKEAGTNHDPLAPCPKRRHCLDQVILGCQAQKSFDIESQHTIPVFILYFLRFCQQ